MDLSNGMDRWEHGWKSLCFMACFDANISEDWQVPVTFRNPGDRHLLLYDPGLISKLDAAGGNIEYP